MDRRIHGQNKPSSWAKVEKILIGRTLHVHALSPLTPPSTLFCPNEALNDENESFKSFHLDRIAKELATFLSVRLTNTLQATDNPNLNDTSSAIPTGSIRRLKRGFIRAVRASFVDIPLPDWQESQVDDRLERMPTPWAIEIEIQPPESNFNPMSNGTDRSQSRTQKAHILFLSNAKFATSTHYPVLLWKAPPSAIYSENVESAQQQSIMDRQKDTLLSRPNDNSTESTVSVTSRMLMAHALDFISRFFDCRISQEAPLCSIRGLNLERISEAILHFHKVHNDAERSHLLSHIDKFGIDLGFALPTQVLCDITERAGMIEDGPAPHLNLISLSIPAADVKALMRGTREGMPMLPGIQQYLALHASIQLNRLTLVRAGVANIFIGVPTATSLISATGQISGEVRLKIGPTGRSNSNKGARLPSEEIDNLERERIGVVLSQLILLSQEDDW